MSGGAIAGLIAAGAFAVLVLFGCYALFKLGKIFDEAAARVRQTGLAIDEGTARVRQAGETVDEVNQALAHVNKELERVDAITANVQTITTNVSSLTSLFAATVGGPVVRVAAFSYGVRSAAVKRARADVATRVKAEMKAEKAARHAPASRAPRPGPDPDHRAGADRAGGADRAAPGGRSLDAGGQARSSASPGRRSKRPTEPAQPAGGGVPATELAAGADPAVGRGWR